MQLLSQIVIQRSQGSSSLQLLQGDLSNIPVEHATDILVMSAFPGNYMALKGSLIYALNEKGLSVEALSRNKESDLRKQLSCWLSKPLSASDQQKFNFRRILCFEPGDKISEPEEVVGDIFRCINAFAFDEDNNVLAMPIIATGYQKMDIQKMLPALLAASCFWLKNGLPVKCIKLVVYRDEQAKQALPIFNSFKNNLLDKAPSFWKKIKNTFTKKTDLPEPPETAAASPAKKGYDYFLSYAHVHSKEIQYFVDKLKILNNSASVFYDKDSIPPGGLWIQQISSAIQQASKVIIFLSPDYDNSPVCWDEFQCAKLMEYNRKKSVIQTVYLYGYTQTEMPPIMGIYSYIDCREGSTDKIDACVQQLAKQVPV